MTPMKELVVLVNIVDPNTGPGSAGKAGAMKDPIVPPGGRGEATDCETIAPARASAVATLPKNACFIVRGVLIFF